ncbi:hypothetical protein HPB49_013071 [Dermacentor silvarum]|uniref:Uncharacterized protein n=1 Tax=Dermacentor silvarum TaxID=543639 RepID=A0ACB8DDD1_DERSI|nr:hypothetical protein HPB49_013071 [Dermacentor silvarum]
MAISSASGSSKQFNVRSKEVLKMRWLALLIIVACAMCNGATALSLADSQSCARFFVCVHGRALLVQCPGPLLFNDRIGVCDWPRNARCAGDRPIAAEAAGGVAMDRWGKVTCVASEGFYASPRDCAEFFRCHRGSAHRFVCARGLVFNDVYKTCDWPRNVRRHGTGRGRRTCRFSKHWQY